MSAADTLAGAVPMRDANRAAEYPVTNDVSGVRDGEDPLVAPKARRSDARARDNRGKRPIYSRFHEEGRLPAFAGDTNQSGDVRFERSPAPVKPPYAGVVHGPRQWPPLRCDGPLRAELSRAASRPRRTLAPRARPIRRNRSRRAARTASSNGASARRRVRAFRAAAGRPVRGRAVSSCRFHEQ